MYLVSNTFQMWLSISKIIFCTFQFANKTYWVNCRSQLIVLCLSQTKVRMGGLLLWPWPPTPSGRLMIVNLIVYLIWLISAIFDQFFYYSGINDFFFHFSILFFLFFELWQSLECKLYMWFSWQLFHHLRSSRVLKYTHCPWIICRSFYEALF